MLTRSAVALARRYLRGVHSAGIPVTRGILYGSFARGEQRADSDVDLLVVSPLFDRTKSSAIIDQLWHLRRSTGYRVEPIAVGAKEFAHRKGSPILAAARAEGIEIHL